MIRQLHITARFFSGQLELIILTPYKLNLRDINLLSIKNLATV